MKLEEILHCLQRAQRKAFTLADLRKLLGTRLDNTLYKTIEKLVKKKFLIRLKNGLYSFAFSPPQEFQIANFLYSPSYISLETALNFYGMLPQFPYTVTSITTRKTRKFDVAGKEFEYVHIQKKLFFDYHKEVDFLIASPEKALIDEIYFVSKGLRKIDFAELNYSKCDRKRLKKIAGRIKLFPFQTLWRDLKL